MFAKRVIEPELLDHLPAADARRNLADLVRINEHFGGHSTIRRVLATVLPRDGQFTLLDVGAASGDTARLVARLYPEAHVTSFDYNETNLGAAPAPKVIGDAFHMPFARESFDYVFCSSFLHHFSDERVIELLRSFYMIARRAVVVCDLERHIAPWVFLPLTKWLYGWGRVTVHDGVISVRAAFRAEELAGAARRAGIEVAAVRRHRPAFRVSLVARKDRGAR